MFLAAFILFLLAVIALALWLHKWQKGDQERRRTLTPAERAKEDGERREESQW